MQNALILIFMADKSPLHDIIVGGISSFLEDYKLNIDVVEHIACRGRNDYIRVDLQKVTSEDVDVLVLIGEQQAKIASEVFKNRKHPPNVVFCAVKKDLGSRLARDFSFMTGVTTEMPPGYLPVQLMLRACAQWRCFLLPYRFAAKFGRMKYEVDRIKKYCSLRKLEVVDVAIDSSEEGIKRLKDAIQKVDIVCIPEGGLIYSDIEMIRNLCEQHNKPIFGDGQSSAASGGFYASKDDFRFMGLKAIVLRILMM